MRRIATLVVLLGLFTISLMASDMNAQPASDVNVSTADQAQSAPEAKPAPKRVYQSAAGETGGTLFKSIFGEGFQKKTGIAVENWIQVGCATNTAVDHYAGGFGAGNWPDPVVNDSGCAVQDMDMAIHRDLVSNLNPQVGPVPGPMPKGFSWGFYHSVMWGRSSQPAAMMGYDKQWSVNDPGDYNSTYATTTRQYFLSTPQAKFQVYMPIWQGMEVTFGRMGGGIGWDIPPEPRPGPDFFASKEFSMVSNPTEIFGLLLSANLLRNQKGLGYVMGEFGLMNGWMTYEPVSGSKDYYAALHWRSAKGSTGVKYSAIFGPKNILPGGPCRGASGLCASNLQGSVAGQATGGTITPGMFVVPGTAQVGGAGGYSIPAYVNANLTSLPTGVGAWGNGSEFLGSFYHVISPRPQEGLSSAITMYHNFNPKVRWVAEVSYGRQWADGQPDTLLWLGPNHYLSGFKGGEWGSVMSFVSYQWKPKWAFGIRGEHFKNQDGLGMYPTCGFYGSTAPGGQLANCKTNLDEITLGLHYDVTRYAMLFPEIRYDFQDDNHGLGIFGVNNLDVAYPVGTPYPAVGVYPNATVSALAPGAALSRNNNAHTHDLVASMNLMLYF